MSPKNETQKSEKFSDEEKGAIKQRLQELKKSGSRGARVTETDLEAEVLATIAAMQDADRVMCERIHAIVKANAPALSPKLWYGMPAYARDGKVVCFFQPAQKFKTRYATFGFNDAAHLDEGHLWPVAYALKELTPADEARIADLVKKAAS